MGRLKRAVREDMQVGLGAIVLVIAILLSIIVLPVWSYSRGWGYGPSTSYVLLSMMTLLLVLMGRL